jgi:hypothetical protein
MSLVGKIQSLFLDREKTQPIFPITKVKAVSDDNGKGLNVLLDDKASKDFVTAKIAEAQLGGGSGGVDLSGFATKDDLNAVNDKIPTMPEQIGAVNKNGDTMTGALYRQGGAGALGVAFGTAEKPENISIISVYDGTEKNRFSFRQYGSNGNRENFNLPDTTAPEKNINYDILTTKKPVTVAQGGTGATDAATARANLGAVSKSGDTMTGALTTTRFYVNPGEGGYPTFEFHAGNVRSAFVQQDIRDGKRNVGFYLYQSDQDDNATKYYTAYNLPAPLTGQTANKVYDILTTKSPVSIAQGGTGATDATTARANLGAAPAGYGLGSYYPKDVSGQDLNSCTQGGFYSWESATNAPFWWGYMIVMPGHVGEGVTQIAYCLEASKVGSAVQRTLHSWSTWSEWEWVNPPMNPGVEYRTTERWNGCAVYAQMKSLGGFTGKVTGTIGNGWNALLRIGGSISYGGYLLKLDDSKIKTRTASSGYTYFEVDIGSEVCTECYIYGYYYTGQ